MKKSIKDTPFGYKTSRELFDKIISIKFNIISNTQKNDNVNTIFERYYDFIFSSGALREWIIKEFNLNEEEIKKYFWNDKYFNVLHSIYNNTKHYTLTENKQKYNVVLDGKSLFSTDDDGNSIWTDGFIWDNEAYWIDKIIGENGNFNYFCEIIEESIQKVEYVYLFEICKIVYNNYKTLLNSLYNR